VRIGAGEVERQARLEAPIELLQRAVEGVQVFVVAAAVRQFDVEIARLLAERKVLRAMQRQGEDRRVVPEDGGGAVALVHVEVDDRDRQRRASARAPVLRLHQPRRDGRIVEDAEAAAPLSRRMVRAAGQVRRDALAQGRARRRDRGTDGAPRAIDHPLTPGEADLAHRARIDAAGRDRGDVGGAVREGEFAIRGRRGFGEPDQRQLGLQTVPQQLVLGRREAVAGRQRQRGPHGMEDLHGPILLGSATVRRICCIATKKRLQTLPAPVYSNHAALQQLPSWKARVQRRSCSSYLWRMTC
jgi:hypothetical protein